MICANPDDVCAPPEVCSDVDNNKHEHLVRHSTNSDESRIKSFMKRDKPLIIAIVAIIVMLNVPYLRYILYPFMIFSTWVHEMCHGMAAIIVGGGIKELFVYQDGSGLAWTYTSGENWKKAFVASAGYTGTALLGSILLLFRRTRRGPTVGCIGIGIAMLLSCALYVRNAFGIGIVTTMGTVIAILGWKLRAKLVGYLFSFLAATCAFNAVESIQELFGGTGYVNGEPMQSDAHSVSEYIGMSYLFWATLWFIFAIVMSLIALIFVLDGSTFKEEQKRKNEFKTSSVHYDGGRQEYNSELGQYQYAAGENLPTATAVAVY
mmetsp:Transcript_29804/g.65610  ORF Transcript_29804/g.65610 Transcript_29804/m.65610 type:complete len:320 (+) Transcript_29804:126-1085(+)